MHILIALEITIKLQFRQMVSNHLLIYLFIYLFVYLFIYLFICLFILIDKNLITYQPSKSNDNVETLVVNQNMRLNLFRSVFHNYGF